MNEQECETKEEKKFFGDNNKKLKIFIENFKNASTETDF